jgi:hypothetical protein
MHLSTQTNLRPSTHPPTNTQQLVQLNTHATRPASQPAPTWKAAAAAPDPSSMPSVDSAWRTLNAPAAESPDCSWGQGVGKGLYARKSSATSPAAAAAASGAGAAAPAAFTRPPRWHHAARPLAPKNGRGRAVQGALSWPVDHLRCQLPHQRLGGRLPHALHQPVKHLRQMQGMGAAGLGCRKAASACACRSGAGGAVEGWMVRGAVRREGVWGGAGNRKASPCCCADTAERRHHSSQSGSAGASVVQPPCRHQPPPPNPPWHT